jgi:hypothetical protein
LNSVVNRVFDLLVYFDKRGALAIAVIVKLNGRYVIRLAWYIFDRLKQGV